MPFAHPTVEHYTPLFVTLGAADRAETPVTTTIDGTMWASPPVVLAGLIGQRRRSRPSGGGPDRC